MALIHSQRLFLLERVGYRHVYYLKIYFKKHKRTQLSLALATLWWCRRAMPGPRFLASWYHCASCK